MAQESVVEMVTKACQKEIDAYCSQVTPGEGRLLSCFYAHEDKLSVQCINALYDGMATLERAVEAISYVANQCRDDIDTLCGETVPGERRVAECLVEKKAEVSPTCATAIEEVGLVKK
jgi:hypothetical protein